MFLAKITVKYIINYSISSGTLFSASNTSCHKKTSFQSLIFNKLPVLPTESSVLEMLKDVEIKE